MLASAQERHRRRPVAFGRALSSNPRSYQALAGLLTQEMQNKNFSNARALIEKQLAQNPNDPTLNLMAAQTYDALGDVFEMEKAFEKDRGSRPAEP
jgi:Tfp pilus assembly protein PilF